MTRLSNVGSFLFLAVANVVCAAEHQLNGHTFTLPDGFEIEVAAKSLLRAQALHLLRKQAS